MKLSRRAEMGSAIVSSLPGWCRSPFRKFKACSVFYFLCCIEIINEAGAITTQVVDKVKLLVQSVHRCSLFHCDLVEREFFTLDCAKKLLTERDNWSAYKAGTFAACQGAWITAAFVFEQLTRHF
ncbi:hypothetical protein OIU78_024172 [Salix suchowensis]|nr:hypothetical protein OIU78_024172 [Salix suchowensis]